MKRGVLKREDLLARSRVDPHDPNPYCPCWHWLGGASDGIPRIFTFDHDFGEKRGMSGPRAVYNIVYGRGPGSQIAYRTCTSAMCVQPGHVALAATRREASAAIAKLGKMRTERATRARRQSIRHAHAARGIDLIPDRIVLACREAPSTMKQSEIARMLGIARQSVAAIRNGSRRADVVGGGVMRQVAALFVRKDSIYKSMPGVDAWDEERDARKWQGGCPVVAHTPCREWGKLRQFSKAPPHEKALGPWSVAQVRLHGGVIEHPAGSLLWAQCCLPLPGRAPDKFGCWTMEIRQCDFGHKAEKLTWLAICGCHPDDLPEMPPRGEPTGVIKPQRGVPRDRRKIVTKAEREATPPALAEWLVELARRCNVQQREAA